MDGSVPGLDIYWRRGRLLLRCCFGLLFGAMCAAAALIPMGKPSSAIWLAAGALVFLAAALRSARLLLASGEPALRLDEDGFESRDSTNGRIGWEDVDDITFAKRRRRLYLDVVVDERAAGQVKQGVLRKLGLSKANVIVFDLSTLKTDAAGLASMVQARVRAAHAAPGARVSSDVGMTRAATGARSGQPVFAYGLIVLLTAILLVETLLRLRPGADPLSIDPLTLFGLGGMQRLAVVDRGEVWRLVTATLLHGGWFHLAGNAVALWFAARLLESLVGWRWFAAIFAVSAVCGSLVSAAVNPPSIVGVGASGGIVGLAAAMAIIAFRYPPDIRVGMLVGGLRIVIPAMMPFLTTARGSGAVIIDVAAHAGGAIAGASVAALLLTVWRRNALRPPKNWLAFGISAVFFGTALLSLPLIVGSYRNARAAAALDPTFPSNFQLAIKQAPALVEAYPRDPRVRAAYAEMFVAKGNVARAEAELRSALDDKIMLQPTITTSLEPFLRVRLAQLLFDEGKRSEAMTAATPVCEIVTGDLKTALSRMSLCR